MVLSELERLFLALLREHGLPLPVTNRLTGAFYVDCRWPDHSVTVELLSYGFHNSRHSWEKDHRRPRDARRRGDRFRTYTWTDVVEDPRDMLRELHELLVPTSCLEVGMRPQGRTRGAELLVLQAERPLAAVADDRAVRIGLALLVELTLKRRCRRPSRCS